MDSCREYAGIDRDRFERLKVEAAAKGVTFAQGDEGPLAFMNVEGIATYTESTKTLRICIVRRPFLIPEALVWRVVESVVQP